MVNLDNTLYQLSQSTKDLYEPISAFVLHVTFAERSASDQAFYHATKRIIAWIKINVNRFPSPKGNFVFPFHASTGKSLSGTNAAHPSSKGLQEFRAFFPAMGFPYPREIPKRLYTARPIAHKNRQPDAVRLSPTSVQMDRYFRGSLVLPMR